MKLLLMERFQRDMAALSLENRSRCFELLMAIPQMFLGLTLKMGGFSIDEHA